MNILDTVPVQDPQTAAIGPQFLGDLFLVITLLNNNLFPLSTKFICMCPLRSPF